MVGTAPALCLLWWVVAPSARCARASRAVSTHEAGESAGLAVEEDEEEEESFVWEPAGGFPRADRKVKSPEYTLRDGSYFWVTYFAKTRYGCNSLRFHLPMWRPGISGRVIAVAQGFPKEFKLTGDSINFGCAKGMSKITFIVEGDSTSAKVDVNPRGHEDGFVWAPAGGFPKADGKVNSPEYTLRDGSYFWVTYFAKRQNQYGCNSLRFHLPKWRPGIRGRVIAVAQGFPKEFKLTGDSINFECATDMSKITFFVEGETTAAKLDVNPREHEDGFVWAPAGGFPKADGKVNSPRYTLRDGSDFSVTYFAKSRYGCNSLRFNYPEWAPPAGRVIVYDQMFPKEFDFTDGASVNLGCAPAISNVTIMVNMLSSHRP